MAAINSRKHNLWLHLRRDTLLHAVSQMRSSTITPSCAGPSRAFETKGKSYLCTKWMCKLFHTNSPARKPELYCFEVALLTATAPCRSIKIHIQIISTMNCVQQWRWKEGRPEGKSFSRGKTLLKKCKSHAVLSTNYIISM